MTEVKKPKAGGKRKGAGRKSGSLGPKALEEREALRLLRKKIMERWDGLIEKKMELAEGIYVMKPIKVGGVVVDVKVYKKEPDGNSLEYLFNVVVGKPKDILDIKIKNKVELTDEQLKQLIELGAKRLAIKKDGKRKAD